jgi:acyl-coenzyme A thioesterase PaaI-like protein
VDAADRGSPAGGALASSMPFAATLGIETLAAAADEVRARLAHSDAFTTTGGALHVGGTVIVIETEVRNDDGKLVAKVTQSQAVLRS